MRNFKKLLSLVLCMAVMLSVMVVGAGAAFSDQKEIKNTEAVDMCVALKIINGYTDGSYKPEGNVTRAEMCKMICIALNGGKEPATATKATPTYTDIKGHWAEGYIEYCNTKGIVAGVGGGKFNPAGNVTGSQAAKMLLVALGYNADVERYTGENWELYVNVQANQDGLYTDLEKMDPSVALTRDNAAQMIWNALQAYVINKTSSIDREDGSITDMYSKDSFVDLLDKMYDGEIEEAELTSFDYNSTKNEWTYTVSGVQVKSSTDYTALLGQNVKAVYDNSGSATVKSAYGIFAVDSKVVLTGVVGDLPKMTTASDTSFKVDGVTYKLDTNAGGTQMTLNTLPVYVFTSASRTSYTAATLYALAGGATVTYDSQNFIAVDRDGNGKIDFIQVTPFSIAKVTYVNSTKFRVSAIYGTAPVGDIKKEDVTVYDGIAKNDYVIITAAANTADETAVYEKADQINGKITVKDGSDVTIDGTVYTLDNSYVTPVKAGTTMKDAVVVNGYIFDGDASGTVDLSDYVVVIDKAVEAYSQTAKLLFSDGTKKVVDLDTDVTTAGSLTTGALYTYDTNKDGEYQLTAAPTSSTGTGYDYVNASATVTKVSNSSTKAGYIDGYKIADDAVIFIRYNSNSSYKVITGATMKTMAVAQFGTANAYVVATDNSTSGVGEVNLAYVTSINSSVKTDNSEYGYILKVVEAQNDDKADIYTVTLMTKNGTINVDTVKKASLDAATIAALVKGTSIEYSVDADGKLDDITNSTSTAVAITGIAADALWLTAAKTRVELDDDVIVLVVDDSENEAVEVGNVDSLAVAEEPTAGTYVPNAYCLVNSDGDIVLVVYDIDNGL